MDNNIELQLKEQAIQLQQEVSKVIVKTQEQYNEAAELLSQVKARIKEINDWFEPLIRAAYKAHKALKDKQNEILEPALEAEMKIKAQMQAYILEQDKKQKELQAKLEAEAEAKRKALEEKARLAAEAGNEAKAEALLEKAQEITAPIIAPSVQVVKTDAGTTSIRRDTVVKVVNINVVLQQIVSGRIPSTVVEISEAKLKAWVKSADIKECPGLLIQRDVPVINSRRN